MDSTNDSTNNDSTPNVPTFTFRFKTARADNSAMVAAILNAVVADNGTVVAVGEMTDDAYNVLTETFGTDDGTTVLRYDVPASRIRSAVDYRAKQLKRRLAFAPLEIHNGEDWAIAGYRVSAR